MYRIEFYIDRNGDKPAQKYIDDLLAKNDKDSRIRVERIRRYVRYLRNLGTYAGEPVIKHIEGDIWELRPAKDRIFFVVYRAGVFVLLHAFTKKTEKTPKRELHRARAEYKDLLERGFDNDES